MTSEKRQELVEQLVREYVGAVRTWNGIDPYGMNLSGRDIDASSHGIEAILAHPALLELLPKRESIFQGTLDDWGHVQIDGGGYSWIGSKFGGQKIEVFLLGSPQEVTPTDNPSSLPTENQVLDKCSGAKEEDWVEWTCGESRLRSSDGKTATVYSQGDWLEEFLHIVQGLPYVRGTLRSSQESKRTRASPRA